MCFRLKHFPAHHNDRTSLTPAVISSLKYTKCVSDPAGAAHSAPQTPSWIREGKGISRRGIGKGRKGKGREGRGKGRRGWEREKRGKGRGGEGPDQVSREIDAPEWRHDSMARGGAL